MTGAEQPRDQPRDPPQDQPRERAALSFGYALLAFILAFLCAVRISYATSLRLPQPTATVLIVAAVAVQCCYLLRLRRWAGPVLLVAALLLEVPFLAWHQPTAGVPSALAVVILMSLPSPLSWWLVAAGTAALMSYDAVLKPETSLVLYTGTELIDNAMFVFVVLQLLATIRRLHATRARLAELAVVTERLRAAGDLRAAIGDGLDEISDHLRGVTALLPTDPKDPADWLATAEAELARVIAIARRCLADARTVARGYRAIGPAPTPAATQAAEDLSTTVARRAGLAVVIAVMLQEVADLWDINRPGWGAMTATALCWVAICVLQFRHSGGGPPNRWPWTLAAQAAVTAALLGSPWWGSAAIATGFLVASIMLLVPRPWCWPLAGVLLGTDLALVGYYHAYGISETAYQMFAIAGFTLVIYAFSRLAGLSTELSKTRERVAQLAVLRERLRLAQDMHDLLGLGLSAIALRGELAVRLLPRDPDRAAAEIAELAMIVAAAEAEVRSVTGSPALPSFEAEVASARAVLETAGVTVRTRLAPGAPPDCSDALFAVVLREAVTNVLRHSTAGVCEIETSTDGTEVTLRVRNDGVAASPNGHGSGLANLTDRLHRAGGTLGVCVTEGAFTLTACVPAGPAHVERDQRDAVMSL
ncbi:MAG TPA: histidine kinase [Streptosporangiaceae bacterium]|nr:histidine kinase [Streptosporangiaceae bacterium]